MSQVAYALYPTTDPWPMWKYDVERSGYTTSTAPNNNQTIWASSASLYPTCVPIVLDGKVIFTGTGPRMYALDETTGVYLWQSFVFQGSPGGNLASWNGRIYVGTTSGYVYCINATNGAKIWENQIVSSPAQIQSSPAVANGKVYVTTTDGFLYALNATTNQFIWYYQAAGPIYSSPAVHGTMIYFGCDDYKVYAVNDAGSSPTQKWRYPTKGQVRSTPCIGDGKVFIGSSSTDHSIFALNATANLPNGQLIWKWTLDSGYTIDTSPAFFNHVVYVTAPYQKAYALDATVAPGNYTENSPIIKKWSTQVGTYPATPAVADGKMFFGANDNKLYALSTSDGHIIWTRLFSNIPNEPIVADGRLFTWNYYGVYCFGNYYPPLTYYYTVTPPGHSYVIELVIANGTPGTTIDITRLLNPTHSINYTVTGIDGTLGMCNITIPNEMLDGIFTVLINGGNPFFGPQIVSNGTHSSLYFTYWQSINRIEIRGTTAVPEFPSTLILPLLMAMSLIAVAFARKKLPKN
jgi:outer membrane protein assembly factor BamB